MVNAAFWKDKRVLVTGGAGFVGRWVGRALVAAAAELHILDIVPPKHVAEPFALHRADLRDLDAATHLLEETRPDAIIHLAGQPGVSVSHDQPVSAYESNVLATFNLLEAARRMTAAQAGGRGVPLAIVAVSSNHVYGHQPAEGRQATPESAALNGLGMYAATKLCGDVLARCYGKSYGVPVGIARMTNSYGGDDHHVGHIITGSILSTLRGERPVIKQSGRDRKGYLYIEDTVDGLLAVAEGVAGSPQLAGEAFNLVPDEAITTLELVRAIVAAADSALEPIVQLPDAPHEAEFLDNTKARQLLGWKPRHDLRAGLRKTIAWYRRSSGA
ncbi:MAG TPA: NAD-dependent epimerase/dehydratase family protein [Pirellulales bacterium]|nr:NAD-dependent epimerase/dehydratase family protein [Pirellulales bacterium]